MGALKISATSSPKQPDCLLQTMGARLSFLAEFVHFVINEIAFSIALAERPSPTTIQTSYCCGFSAYS
jgi:hypothetical protein